MIEMKIHQRDGVAIDAATVNQWRHEAFEALRDNPELPFWYCMSGDTLILGLRDEYAIEIYHAKLVDSATLIATTTWKSYSEEAGE